MIKKDLIDKFQDSQKFDLGLAYIDTWLTGKGKFFITVTDEEGNVTEQRNFDNIITYDAGILAARLCKDPLEPPHGFNMLAVGTGATGAVLAPDAPDRRQRKLNSEIERKAFSTTVFRDSLGTAVAYPTNVVDFTTTFGAAEAVGPLNEMGILSTISANPAIHNLNPNAFPTRDVTLDLSNYDILCNYLTFPVISKPAGSSLTITWRITFG